LVGTPLGKLSCGGAEGLWEGNVKMHLKQVVGTASGLCPMVGFSISSD